MQNKYKGLIKLVIFDVDGVLTDGTLYLSDAGEVIKKFSVKDGLAIALLRAHGIQSGIISGKSSLPLDYRIKQLKIDIFETGRLDKLSAYQKIRNYMNLNDNQIAYIGDDVVDLPLLDRVGVFYAPADAHELVRKNADHVLLTRGGEGAARELVEHILMCDGLTLDEIYQPLINEWMEFNAVQ